MNTSRFSRLFCAALLILCSGVTPARSATPLTGRYVLWQKTVTTSKIPVLKDVTAQSIAVALVDINHDGERLRGEGRLCDLRLESNTRLVKTTFPAAFIKALPPVRIDAAISQRGGEKFLSSTTQTLVIGAQLERPQHETLPQAANDPRVIDQDKDGKPGMTVRVDGLVSGEIYVVQRSSTQYSGPATRDGFAGRIHVDLEQVIVGASSALLRRGSTPEPNHELSAFALGRMSNTATCAQAVALARKRYH
jgi:hypothetical protein